MAWNDRAPAEKTCGSVSANRLLLLLVVALAAALISVRFYVNSGWGGDRLLQPGEALSAYGFEHGGEDNLSYLSWIQQTRLGHFWLSDLYTTERHSSLVTNITFYAIGRASALFALNPAFVFNLCGFVGALLAVAFVFRYAVWIGFSTGAAFWASFVVAFGSGLSWVPYVLDHISGAHFGFGADMTYLDLIPSTVFHMFPDHAIALALLSFLMLSVVKLEKGLLSQASCRWRILAVFVGALLLSMSRPYEPAAFFVVYSLYTMLPLVLRKERAAFRARLIVWSVLAVPVIMFAAYDLWVASHPVWSNLAEHSLNLPKNGVRRTYWILGFGFVWVLAAVGVVETFRRKLARFELAAVWSIFVFAVLIILNSGRSKLATGAFVSLALMAGPVLDGIWHQLFQGIGGWRTGLRVAVIAVLTGVLSPVFVHLTNRLSVPTIDPEIVFAGEQVRQDARTDFPTVLTDREAGDLLPGLWGMRVYVGHWMLSPHCESKLKEIEVAGLEPLSQSEPSLRPETAANFDRLLNNVHPEYVMIRTSLPLAKELKLRSPMVVVYQGSRWVVFATRYRTPT